MLRALASAFGYFSILPVRTDGEPPTAAALDMLPLVGIVVGGASGFVAFLLYAWLHVGWAFVVAWLCSIALTGAIHIDGFLDSCDALFARAAPERRLEILRDPHHGTYAVAGMAMLAAAWLAALASIDPSWYPLSLAFAGGTSRLAARANAWAFAYARNDGHAAALAVKPRVAPAVVWFVLLEALAFLVTPRALWVAPVAIALGLGIGWWANRKLGGGITGDVYGAIVCVVEVACLLLLVAAVR